MLISPPFLPARGAAQTENDWLDACMTGGAPGEGAFPVSFNLGWHGGVHLTAPAANPATAGNLTEKVRAIADGTVVFVRPANQRVDTATDPQNYKGGWTDKGCVVIRHDTEIGEGANATGTIRFFSIYMHLSEIDATIAVSRAIDRKAVLGRAGLIYGSSERKIHFEIVCDETNLARLVGRASGDLVVTTNGRTDAVFGEVYFHLPAGANFYAARPALNNQAVASAATHSNPDALILGIRYASGDGAANTRGHAYLKTYRLDGSTIGETVTESNAEYDLHVNATAICNAYPLATRPAPSIVYELLRFGRAIGPDALNPATVPHWRKVNYSGGQGWVNLNAPNVHKFSDADYPQWKGWKLINDDTSPDSHCDSATIKGWLDPQNAGLSAASAEARLKDNTVQEKLKKAIFKFPSEWDSATIDARWGWLKKQSPENPTPMSSDDFDTKFKPHVTALAFWPGGTGIDANHWHFEPREFIKHFRTPCVWSDLIRRWGIANTSQALPDETNLKKFAKTALYEFGLRSSLAATKDHTDQHSSISFTSMDNRIPLIFGMRVETDVNANSGKGLWDDRVTVLKRDETGLLEHRYSGPYTTEPSGKYLARGEFLGSNHPTGDGVNVGGTQDKDLGRLTSHRTYEYAPVGHSNTQTYGALRFGNSANPNLFNILKKPLASQVDRLVVNVNTLPAGQHISQNNSTWQTGAAAGYSEERTMYFHRGYTGMTGSAGCQTFPVATGQKIDDFMAHLQPMTSASRFQYVLTVMK